MLDISYSPSRPQIVEGTEQKFEQPEAIPKQSIEIPLYWLGSRFGSIRIIKRSVSAIGTVEVRKYGSVKRTKYGTAKYNGWTVLVLQDFDKVWRGIDKK